MDCFVAPICVIHVWQIQLCFSLQNVSHSRVAVHASDIYCLPSGNQINIIKNTSMNMDTCMYERMYLRMYMWWVNPLSLLNEWSAWHFKLMSSFNNRAWLDVNCFLGCCTCKELELGEGDGTCVYVVILAGADLCSILFKLLFIFFVKKCKTFLQGFYRQLEYLVAW